MSASIHYAPGKPGKRLDVNAPSSFLAAFEAAGLRLPRTLGTEDIAVLRGLAAGLAQGFGASGEPVLELIEAIEKYGSIDVKVSW